MIDLILTNGHIATQDIFKPMVSALAVSGGRIVAYGRDQDVVPLANSATRRYDLDGRVVVPGLIDAHIHWEQTAKAIQQVSLHNTLTKKDALDRVAQRAAETPPGEWIEGYGWAQDLWRDDPAFPTAADLDAIAPRHPVFLVARSFHAGWVNSKALELANITAATRDPVGGQIMHDERGDPTGILLEPDAMNLIRAHIPEPTPERLADYMQVAQAQALAAGLTGLHDFDEPSCLRSLQLLRERGDLALRVVKNINMKWLHAALDTGLRWGFGDNWLRIGGLKMFADGAIGPHTAAMVEPYEGEPDNYGMMIIDKEEMIDLAGQASAAGLPSTIHAIGDRAVRDVLDVYQIVREQEAEQGIPRETRRHRIEHVQIIHPDDLTRLARLDVVASMQPLHATADMEVADRYWGDRSVWSYNPRIQLDQGVVVAFGSDSPVEPFDPIKGIHAAATRRRADGAPDPDGWYPAARLNVEESVRCFTFGPAYAAGMEAVLGKLAPGFLADLVVLDRDLFRIPLDELLDVNVVATMVGGDWRYGGLS
jgi:hypothetical protein